MKITNKSKNKILLSACGLLVLSLATPGMADVLNINSRVRDFNDDHPDMEAVVVGLDPGITENLLGINGKPVYTGEINNPSTHGQTAFDQWYHDVNGVNMGMDLVLNLDNSITPDSRVYTYKNADIFPVDDLLLGNQGREHNYHFTIELHTTGVYQGGEILKFKADDDLFVFINDQLAIDLGGIHRPQSAGVSLDDIAVSHNLTIGQEYSYDLFYAERHTKDSHLRFELSTVPAPGSMALAVMGVLCIGSRRRRKA